MPSQNHLTLFAQQLATWAEQIIENGRTPFRRVDLFHQLQTDRGPCKPPLIFWINRQSMIAGGLVFLPDNHSDRQFKAEAAAAISLGLRHFVTWEAEQINIWQVTTDKNQQITSFPVIASDDPAMFHHCLYDIIDQLKLLSVTGRIEASAISPYYLLNLLTETLELALPALMEYCRSQRSDHASILSAEEEATSWNRLTLLRLLCLHNWHLIPENLPIENISATLEKQLEHLPAPLGDTLHKLLPSAKVELPTESTVAFHHLMLRIQQIGWQESFRGTEVLKLLLLHWYQPGNESACGENQRLLLHSRELAPSCQDEISHFGAQLAANCLWRTLHQTPHPQQEQGDAFTVNARFDAKTLHANFYGDLRPDPIFRREIAGHLRSSWPNRKLTIPGNLPFWAIETIHILGLSSPNNQIELHLPSNWLRLLAGTFFCELLFSNFAIQSLDCCDTSRHLLKLRREPNEGLTECLLTDGSTRTVELGAVPGFAASRLLYTLELSTFFFKLFIGQHLRQLCEKHDGNQDKESLFLYSQSDLGQYLWDLQTDSQIPSISDRIEEEALNKGWLIPDQLHLEELKRLVSQLGQTPNRVEINNFIALLFNIPQEEQHSLTTTTPHPNQGNKPVNRSIGEELLRQLEIDGIPHFPQTYLYRQSTGPLVSYKFTPPLKLNHELLGQYELEDAEQNILQVTGEETKDALLLASTLGLSSLEIPLDRHQTAEMLDSYRQDLQELQEKMTRLCHRHIEQLPAAQRLQKKIWQQLPLPPPKWLSD